MKAEKKVMCSSQDEVFMSHDLDLQELQISGGVSCKPLHTVKFGLKAG